MECGRCHLIDWADLQGKLDRVPDKLRDALDKTFSKRKQRIFRVRYPYGTLIIDHGRFVPPCKGDLCSNCRLLVEETGYSQIPLALLLKNPAEVFIDYSQSRRYDFRFAPLRLIPEGDLLGTFEVLDALIGTRSPRPGWSVTSGARSVWVLAPLGNDSLIKVISGLVSNKAGRQVKLTWDKTWDKNKKVEQQPHWRFIQACMAEVGQWSTELIVFPGGTLTSSDRASDLLNEMLTMAWKYSAALRQSSIEDTTIRDVVASKNLPGGEMHHYAAMRHFLNIMTGAMPAYRSSNLVHDQAGPFLEFCDLLVEALKKINGPLSYRPIVMQPPPPAT